MRVLHGQSASVVIEDCARPVRRPVASAPPFTSRDDRPEVEGLRGLAILSLLAIHSMPDLSRGGVIGIDIFFVVSGYLLARRILKHRAGSLDWSEFIARRLQRAVPALLAVLLGCLAFATLFTLPADVLAVGRSLVRGASFMTNVDAWRRGLPIDAAQNLDPLWHLWQVAAVAQGGLLLGSLAWALQPHRRVWLALVAATGVASLAFNLLQVADFPAASFYLLAGRWWELMAGVGLAVVSTAEHRPTHPVVDLGANSSRQLGAVWSALAPHMGWLGVGCFAVAILLAGDTNHFPGSWALWPVAGTACLLAGGPRDWVNRHVFAQPVLRFYGRVSYPLYLWHWPALCFPLLLGVPLSVDVRVLILIASVVLAALTHELIEKPIAALEPTRRLSGLLLAGLAACLALGASVVATDGLRFTFPAELQSLSSPRTPGAH